MISDNFLDCVVYVYPTEKQAHAGDNAGGSGFLVAIPITEDDPRSFGYIVTARHVLGDSPNPAIRVNTVEGSVDIIATSWQDWLYHPSGDDVTACPIGLASQQYRAVAINPADIYSGGLCLEKGVGLGSEVFFVGRFKSLAESEDQAGTNIPTLRHGQIAASRLTPIKHPNTGIWQESYVVEARSLSGYSGSPVFVYAKATHPNVFDLGPGKTMLLGLDWAHLHDELAVRTRGNDHAEDHLYVKANSGVMGVIPGSKILDVLFAEQAVDQRERELRDLESAHSS